LLNAVRFLRRNEIVRDECGNAGVRLQMIELDASDEEIAHRLRQRDADSYEVSDARIEDFAKLSAAYESTAQIPGLIKVSTTGELSGSVREVLQQLAKPRP